MKNKFFYTLFLMIIAFNSSFVAADIFKNPAASLNSFCKTPSPRQTLIYLDQSIIATKDEDWFKDIRNKLKFLPSERIQVLMISSEDSRVKDVWSVCYPSMSKKQYEQEKENQGLFETSVDKKIADAKSLYNKYLNSALAAPLAKTKLEHKPNFESHSFPSKSLVEAIYYDSGRFDLSNGITRVVIFSDMVENSEYASPINLTEVNSLKLAQETAERYPMELNNAQFFVYGIGYSHGNSSLNLNLQKYWENLLIDSGAYLASFHSQLNLPKTSSLSFSPYSYTGVMMQANGTKVATDLRLGFAENGVLTNSWFGVLDDRYPLKGGYVCKQNQCTVNAEIIFSGDPEKHMFRKKDIITLTGELNKLKGTIGAKDDLTRTGDGSKFSMVVLFEQDNSMRF